MFAAFAEARSAALPNRAALMVSKSGTPANGPKLHLGGKVSCA
jgi:hypothetical protein